MSIRSSAATVQRHKSVAQKIQKIKTKTAAEEKRKYGSNRAAHLTTAASCNCQSPTTTMQQPVRRNTFSQVEIA